MVLYSASTTRSGDIKRSSESQGADTIYDHNSSALIHSQDREFNNTTALLHTNRLSSLHSSFTMKRSFKVLICGAGVSGLSLALMLERLGIDYLVLEAYPEVTASVGAAVVLLPNGLRILDQLGVYESFKKQHDQGPVTDAKFFSPEGQVLGSLEVHDLVRWYVHNSNITCCTRS